MRVVRFGSFALRGSLAFAAISAVFAGNPSIAAAAAPAQPASVPPSVPASSPETAADETTPTTSPNGTPYTYYDDCQQRKRSGLVVGLDLGLGLAGASGYPNQSSKIGDPAYYASSPLLAGGGGWITVGAALADWVNFGVWAGAETFTSKNWISHGGGAGFRVELFPFELLYKDNKWLTQLGLLGQFGIAGAQLEVTTPHTNYPSVDGTQSFLAGGAFYEWNLGKGLGGHFAAGPSIEYDAILTQSFERHGALLAGRLVWYGGAP